MKVKFETEFESDEVPADQAGLTKWANAIAVKALEKARAVLELELAKVVVSIDAVERDAPEDIPASILKWLEEQKAKVEELPKVSYESTSPEPPQTQTQQEPPQEATDSTSSVSDFPSSLSGLSRENER